MNQIPPSLITNQCGHTTSIRSHTRITFILTMLIVLITGTMCLTGCSKQNNDPDYIALFNLNDLSSEFKQYELLPEDNEYRDKDLKAMIWDSKDIITTGTYQNATTFRAKQGPGYYATEIPEWFLKRGFTCGSLTALAGKYLAPPAIPHVYSKGNTLIHVFRYWAPTLKNDDKLYGAHVSRIAVIQYKNVTQNFYPCQGNGWVALGGINETLPIIKHQDGHVTIDHTHSNEEQESGERLEKKGFYKKIFTPHK